MTPTTDLRRVRGAATRATVVRAASELFAADGYSATSIAGIASAAGVRSASIYHAFGSKEGLLAAVVEDAAGGFFSALRAPGTHPDGIWAELAEVADAFARRPEFLRLLIMLAVERREGDAEILQTAVGVRIRAREWIADALAPQLADLQPAARADVSERMGRLLLMLLDGAFVSRQLEATSADMGPLFDLITQAARATLAELVAAHREAAER